MQREGVFNPYARGGFAAKNSTTIYEMHPFTFVGLRCRVYMIFLFPIFRILLKVYVDFSLSFFKYFIRLKLILYIIENFLN